MRGLRRTLLVFVLGMALLTAQTKRAEASAAREVLLTSTYGVVAGSIVGLASIAFTTNPGGNLQNIAVGASLGLYVGIVLGLYVAYGISLDGGDEGEEEGGEEGDEGLLDEPTRTEDRKSPEGEVELPEEPPEDSPDLNEGSLRYNPRGIAIARGVNLEVPLISVAPQWSQAQGKLGWLAYAQLVRVNF